MRPGSGASGGRWIVGFVIIVIVSAIGIGAVLATIASVIADDVTPVLSLREGECVDLDLPPTAPDLDRLGVVDCDGTHTGEVFHVGQLDPDGDRVYPPTDEILFRAVIAGCIRPGESGQPSPFERYVGVPISESVLDLLPIAPDPDAWVPTGGRFVCLAIPADDDGELVGSVRDSGH